MATRFVSNEEIRAACIADAAGYRPGERVVARFSDGPPFIYTVGDGSFADRHLLSSMIWGRVTPEAERLVAERERGFQETWGR